MTDKYFKPSDYEGISEYWVSMKSDSRPAACGKTTVMYGYEKISRMKCDYDLIFSYKKVIGRRYVSRKKEIVLVLDSYSTPTTRKHISATEMALKRKSVKYISVPNVDVSTTEALIGNIDWFLESMVYTLEKISRARNINIKEHKKVVFNNLKKEAICFWKEFKHLKNRSGKEYKLLQEISLDSEVKTIKKRVKDLVINREAKKQKERLKKRISEIKHLIKEWKDGQIDYVSIPSGAKKEFSYITRIKDFKIESITGDSVDVLTVGLVFGSYLYHGLKKGEHVGNCIFMGKKIKNKKTYFNIGGVMVPESLIEERLKSVIIKN